MCPIALQDSYALVDQLSFEEYRTILKEMILTADTPITVGVFGGWGSGKTTLLRMLEADVRKMDEAQHRYRIVWFNAWKYRKEEVLWRALILHVLNELRPRTTTDDGKCRLLREDELDESQRHVSQELDRLEDSLYRTVQWEEYGNIKIDWREAATETAKSAVNLIVALSPAGVFAAKAIEAAQEAIGKGDTASGAAGLLKAFQRETKQRQREHLVSFEQFERDFGVLVNQYVVQKGGRLIVFIDDLDRCLPEKTVDILEAVNLFLDVPGCVFVIAADRKAIETGIEIKYSYLQEAKRQEALVISGSTFLEKMIQLPFHLPPLDRQRMANYIKSLDPQLSLKVSRLFALGIEPNPRKIKRAINIFKLTKRIAELRRSIGKINLEVNESLLAKMVVIQSRLPELYARLPQTPTLIQQLEMYHRGQPIVPNPAKVPEGKSTAQSLAEHQMLGSWDEILRMDKDQALASILSWGEEEADYFSSLSVRQLEQYVFLISTVGETESGVQARVDQTKVDQGLVSILLSADPVKIRDIMLKLREQNQSEIYRSVLRANSRTQEDPLLRWSAGIALGYLDEPEDANEMVEIEGGSFVIGSKNEESHQVPSFRIGKYLVTNAQYGRFISEGGYSNKTFWTDEGWEVKEQYAWAQPAFWGDPRLNQPNQPVVGVSWYEAKAYATWAKKRLPTELEWECAARGKDGRTYPWGEDFSPNLANTAEAGIGTTTPVGFFPLGASPYGVTDMAGNVWEWTETKHESGGMVLHGGSWTNEKEYARAYFRFRDRSSGRYNNQGFRVAD